MEEREWKERDKRNGNRQSIVLWLVVVGGGCTDASTLCNLVFVWLCVVCLCVVCLSVMCVRCVLCVVCCALCVVCCV